MREAYAHEAVLMMEPDADLSAPGAAITVALCGHWEHQHPCPLAPHHTRVDRDGDHVHVRVLFAAAPDSEHVARERIDSALSTEQLTGPSGVTTRWQVLASRRSVVQSGETDHADRLVYS